MIITNVFRRSNGEFMIEEQDELDILIIMRSVFYQNIDKIKNKSFKQQIRYLNFTVIDEVVPGIMTEIKLQIGYMKHIDEPMNMLDRPKNVSNSGLKYLSSTTKTF